MQSNAIRLQIFFYHVDVETCCFVYQNPLEIVLSSPHYIVKPLCIALDLHVLNSLLDDIKGSVLILKVSLFDLGVTYLDLVYC